MYPRFWYWGNIPLVPVLPAAVYDQVSGTLCTVYFKMEIVDTFWCIHVFDYRGNIPYRSTCIISSTVYDQQHRTTAWLAYGSLLLVVSTSTWHRHGFF